MQARTSHQARSARVCSRAERRRFLVTTGFFAFAVFFFWWAAWRPGFIDGQAIERLARLRRFELTTDDPAVYTVILWLTSLGGRSAALATLLQGLCWAAIAAVWAGRLTQLGAPRWIAGPMVGVLSLLPAIAVGLLAIWPATILALAAAWVLTELLARPLQPLRLGGALGLLAALGGIGLVAASTVAVVVAFGEHTPGRRAVNSLLITAVSIGAVGWLIMPLAMDRGEATTRSLAPIVASALTHHGDDFSAQERAELSQMADLDLWRDLYDCGDIQPLLTDPEFDRTALSAERLRAIGLETAVQHPFMSVGQRLCAGANLMTPALPKATRFYLPAYTVFPNSIGVTRSPLIDTALDATKAILIRAQAPDRLLWWWRPALPVAAAGLVFALAAARKRRSAIGASLLVGLLAGTLVVGPTPSFDTALPLYLVGWLSASVVATLGTR